MTREEALADLVRRGVTAAREGRWAAAAADLTAVADDPDFLATAALDDLRARVLAVLARSLVEAGTPWDALPRIDAALALATRVGDVEELPDLRALRETAKTAAATARRVTSPAPLPDPLSAPSGVARALALCATAEAALRSGQPTHAAAAARAALEEAPAHELRPRMLARLAWARAAPESAADILQAAWREADAAGDPAWITAVANAARLAAVRVGT